jgi:phosphoribosylanthranilate isomerase
MALRTLVKIGGVTNLSDARYCAGMGVDLLGFGAIEGQPGFIAASEFREIRGWISGPKIVAEVYGLNNPGELDTVLADYQPDYLEMSVRELTLLRSVPLPFILSVDSDTVLNEVNSTPAYVQGGQYLRTYQHPFIIKIDSNADLRTVENEPAIVGIAMMGSSEIRPGLKSYDHIADVLEALEVD